MSPYHENIIYETIPNQGLFWVSVNMGGFKIAHNQIGYGRGRFCAQGYTVFL